MIGINKKVKFNAYVLAESKKMEVYQNYMTNDITKYHSSETVSQSKMI